MIRAKFRCLSVTKHDGGAESVELMAVSDDANKQWSQWTPSGNLKMSITNTAAQGKFVPGECYFIDLALAPAVG